MNEKPLVKISSGLLEGKLGKDLKGKPFYSFEGIPYAAPPVGKLRFKAPVPIQPWQGVRKAWSKEPSCAFSLKLPEEEEETGKPGVAEALAFLKASGPSEPWTVKSVIEEASSVATDTSNNQKTSQRRLNIITGGSEDCLYLNVFTPSLPKNQNELHPVMVYIHGGGFVCGRTHPFGPEVIVAEDTILVTVGYRLGVLGFLSIDDPELGATGNAGMKDMVLSLKWVQENIRAFNGDNNNVTIIGESAGGAAVDHLLLSPTTKGLFQRAILQSGCSNIYFAKGYKNRESSIAKHFGCPYTNNEELLKYLQAMPLAELLDKQLTLEGRLTPSTHRYNAPVVEHPEAKDAFFTEDPVNILVSGRYQDVPIIVGFNNDEGMFFTLPIFGFSYDESVVVPTFLDLKRGSKEYLKVARKIRHFYLKGGSEFDEDGILNENGRKLAGDIAINIPMFQRAKHHLKNKKNPVYIYRLSVSTKLGTISKGKFKGVCHADDFGYLFLMPDTPEVTPGSIEDITRARFVKLLTNFAKTGNPNPQKTDKLFTTTWEPAREERNMRLLEIAEKLSMVDEPEADTIEFWDQIYKTNRCPL